jgi:Coenzyme PQQ synthesis protein D (PqqD)
MMISAGSGEQLVCNPNVTFQRLGDDLVVVNLESDTIYTLNATAAVVWEMLHNGSDGDAVCDRLLADYDVGKETIGQELDEALIKLKDFGLLIPYSSPE